MPTNQATQMLRAVDKQQSKARLSKRKKIQQQIIHNSKGSGLSQNKQQVLDNQRNAQVQKANKLADMLYKKSINNSKKKKH